MDEETATTGVVAQPEADHVISVLEDRLEGAMLLADPTAKSAALKAIILSQESAEEDLRVKDHAITALLSLYVSTGDVQSTTSLLAFLRPYFSVIPKARTAKQVRSVIESLARIPNSTEAQVALCMETIEWCKAEKRSFLRLRIQLKLSQLLLDQGKLPLALSSITGLLREVKRLDDKALLVELHLIESRVLFELRNLPKSRASLTAGRTAAGSIYIGPEVQGEIDMQAGILHAEERDYRTAFSYFYEAFEGRNSVGGGGKAGAAIKAAAAAAASAAAAAAAAASASSATSPAATATAAAAAAPHPAVAPLKYMLLCKILMGQPEDVPGLIAGKAGLKYAGKGLDALRAMAQAYADRSLTAFERVVGEFAGEVSGDGFITRHVAHLTDKLLEQNLLRLIEPFSCVELSHLSDLIGLPAQRVEAKLGQLILDKRVHATLDQGKGQLVVFDGEGPDKAYTAALKAIGNLGKVVDVLQKRAETDK